LIMKKIYDPSKHPGELIRVFGMFSGGASSLRSIVEDPNIGELYNLVGTFTNKPQASGIGHMEDAGIPIETLDYRGFHRNREGYFEEVGRILEQYDPDLIALSGFMLIIPKSFVERYSDRILNVHPADLGIMTGPNIDRLYVGNLSPSEVVILMRDNQLKRKFVGDNAVYDAVMVGEESVNSTIHIVRPGTDTGPIIVQSREFLVDIPPDMSVKEYSGELQNEMKWAGDGPAYLKTLEFLAMQRLGMGEDGLTIFLDGNPLSYMGYQLTE